MKSSTMRSDRSRAFSSRHAARVSHISPYPAQKPRWKSGILPGRKALAYTGKAPPHPVSRREPPGPPPKTPPAHTCKFLRAAGSARSKAPDIQNHPRGAPLSARPGQ